jgi:hypothetical protein
MSKPKLVQSQPQPDNPALLHCRAEMARAYRKVMKSFHGSADDRRSEAVKKSCEAYRDAMPRLTTPENIRDFIACFTHGMLAGVFYQWESQAYLAAARTAMRTFHFQPKPQNPAAEPNQTQEKRDCKSEVAA